MSILFIDQVQVTPVTTNVDTRDETEGVAVPVDAYVEFQDRIDFDSQGQPIRPTNFIMLPSGTSIKYGDYIEVTKMRKDTPSTEEAVRRKVTGVFPVAGLSKNSHLEIRVEGGVGG